MSSDTLETHLESFPITIEVVRLCHDQGDYGGMSESIRNPPEVWSSDQRTMLQLMVALGEVVIHRGPTINIQDLYSSTALADLVRPLAQASSLRELDGYQVRSCVPLSM